MLEILRIKISNTTMADALALANDFFEHGKHFIVTPNPEIILCAQTNSDLMHIINKANLSLPDGIGLKFAAWLLGKNIQRITGADFLPQLLKIANLKNKKIGIINWKNGLSNQEDINTCLKNIFPNLEVNVVDVDKNYDINQIKAVWEQWEPNVVFVALGSPEQEILAYKILNELSSIQIVMVVGGGFDFLCGKQLRAPKFLRIIGFEWLWRLIRQPSRWRRIFNATIVFPLVVFRNLFIRPFLYRRNVVGFIYQNDEVLLLNWSKDDDYWSLPQGGREAGETDQQAIKREMLEEIGNNDFEISNYYNNVFKYTWPKTYSLNGFKGQKQSLFLLKYTGKKEDIKLSIEHKDFKWIKISDLIKESHEVREKAYKIFLEKYYEHIKQ